MSKQEKSSQFEKLILPHLDAAYNLARWLVHNEEDAADLVQDAFLKAFRLFATYRNGPAKAWILTIVRNTAYDFLRKKGRINSVNDVETNLETILSDENSPSIAIERASDIARVEAALNLLPTEYRETIILREIEGFSYKEIAAMTDVPIGTIMSRIARGRDRLRMLLKEQ